MARPQNRKRQRADEPSRADTDPPAKKIKTRSEIELDAWASWEYPPEFWDRLSKIDLTHRALKELDRRTCTQRSHPSPPASPGGLVLSRTTTTSRDLARFARHGGPKLCDLRGYPHPSKDHRPSVAMSASRSSRSRGIGSTNLASTLPTSATTKAKKSTTYDRGFDLHLTDHQVYATYSSQKPDLAEVRAALAVPRPSLSPSKFSDGAFETFQESNARAKDEDDVLANVMPTILGPSQANHYCARNTVFGNLEPLTDDTITAPKPDIYYGAYPERLARSARSELGHHIIPSKMEDKPMAPNFFIEAKGPDGSAAVAKRQARYDGAIGSRAMHSLQNYGNEDPEYDGNPYTFSSTYHDGQLQIYTHHVTAPTSDGGRPEYHMTQLDAYAMTGKRDICVEGIGALRNTADLAQSYRDRFIEAANARASQAETVTGQEATTTVTQHTEDSTDELALSPPRYLYEGDDSQDPLSVDPPMSFTTSLTSSFSSFQTRSKRQRSPRLGAQVDQVSKSRTRRRRAGDLALPATGTTRADATESL